MDRLDQILAYYSLQSDQPTRARERARRDLLAWRDGEVAKASAKQRLSFMVVDELAKEIADEFQTHDYYRWYCKAIYRLGIEKVLELRISAREGKSPGRLFSARINGALARLSKESEGETTT